MHFTTSFLSVVAALLVVGANSNPAASTEAELNARTTIVSGDASFFVPDGNVGACGAPLQNWDFVVALPSAHYDNGAHCGQHINVEYNGKNINVTVGDLCPGGGTDDIDPSEGAFVALADLTLGFIPVQWNFK
ncbi:RlpA-like double-psi beta-barrel-protein domain-containing protein-containing protein [Mycena sanguinolenta]|nr:RlpA-like double-psi beta-barrel-protein domain-containing protein-containing protein [Mycena sanguinolenta]